MHERRLLDGNGFFHTQGVETDAPISHGGGKIEGPKDGKKGGGGWTRLLRGNQKGSTRKTLGVQILVGT